MTAWERLQYASCSMAYCIELQTGILESASSSTENSLYSTLQLRGQTSSTHLLAASLHVRMLPSFDCPAEGHGVVKRLPRGAGALQEAAGRADASSLQI